MARWPSRSGSGLAQSIASQTSLAESQHCHFAFVAELFMCGPPVGGTFWFQIFIQASSPEIWRKTIFGGEGGCWRGKWGGLFWATSFGKKFTGGEDIAAARFGTEKALEPRARFSATAVKCGLSRLGPSRSRSASSACPLVAI